MAPGRAEGAVDAPEALDELVRRVDPDRWLASCLIADPKARATVVAVSALNYELARAGEVATTPLAGEIRLAWWRDRLEDLFETRAVAAQPALQALAEPIRSGMLPRTLFDALIEARHADLEPSPFADDAALIGYVDGTAGAVMGLAARALSPEAPLRSVVEAGRAWGLAGLHRTRASWRSRGRDWLPPSWGSPSDAELGRRIRGEVLAALAAARRELKGLPVAAFPAVAYATLAKPYGEGRSPGEVERRVRLVIASATGRL